MMCASAPGLSVRTGPRGNTEHGMSCALAFHIMRPSSVCARRENIACLTSPLARPARLVHHRLRPCRCVARPRWSARCACRGGCAWYARTGMRSKPEPICFLVFHLGIPHSISHILYTIYYVRYTVPSRLHQPLGPLMFSYISAHTMQACGAGWVTALRTSVRRLSVQNFRAISVQEPRPSSRHLDHVEHSSGQHVRRGFPG